MCADIGWLFQSLQKDKAGVVLQIGLDLHELGL